MMPRPLFLLVLLATGCATAAAPIAGTPPSPVTVPAVTSAVTAAAPEAGDPLEALANAKLLAWLLEDADATLAWVDERVKAGKLDVLDATSARACPTMAKLAVADFRTKVLALKQVDQALRARAGDLAPTGGHPQLILRATKFKWGDHLDLGAQATELRQDVLRRMDAVVSACRALVPAQQIDDLLRLAGKAGLTSVGGPIGAGLFR